MLKITLPSLQGINTLFRRCLRFLALRYKLWKRIVPAITIAFLIIVTGHTVSAQLVEAPSLESLKTVPVPEPPNLNKFVKNKAAAIVLGKSIFWDMQVGSDGRTSCASCHFHAGADNRSKNQLSPGLLAGDTLTSLGLNYQLQPGDYPFHKLADVNDRNSTVLADTNDVTSSQGVFGTSLTSIIPGKPTDVTSNNFDTTFNIGGVNVRRVEPRNTPSVINAVFNFRNFWDGRAQHEFNGRNPFGNRDPNALVAKATGASATLEKVEITNASLASQAVGPPLSSFEMSAGNRSFSQLGRKMLSVRPLALQQVAADDSVLANQSRWPLPGLKSTYTALIKSAFQDEWWNANSTIVKIDANGKPSIQPKPSGNLGNDEFTLMEYNFPLFFGLAVQLYEATLVSDNTPVDQYLDGKLDALTEQQKIGLDVFQNKGKCINCHSGAEMTNASVRNVRNEPIERMIMGNNQIAVYDNGFYNIGVRPTTEDVGVGGQDPFGNPLSLTKFKQQQVANGAPAPIIQAVPDDNIPAAPLDPNERAAVNGAFKTPSLRNVELTAPYFHNGGQATLRQVVDFYNRGSDFNQANQDDLDPDIQNLGLTEDEKDALVAFLKGLTDERVRYRRAPFDHPQLFITNGHAGDQNGVTNDSTGKAVDNLINIPAVGRNGGTPLPTFLGINAAASAPLRAASAQPSLKGSITPTDCPSGSVLKLVASGYACLPK
jgi:cytochrome c peroxidase